MPFGASQHVVSIKCHTPSRRMPIGASRQLGHFFNAISHHDGCRLVHPAKWDIGRFWGAVMTDVDWCIPSGNSFGTLFTSQFRRIPFGESRPYHHSLFIRLSIITFNFIFTFISSFKDILNLCTYFIYSFLYSFTYTHLRILIHVFIYIYSFICSCHILIHVYSFTHTHSYIHSRILSHVYSFTYTHSYTNLYTHSHIHSCILIHVYSFMYTHFCILIHILIYILIHIFIHVYLFMYTHS